MNDQGSDSYGGAGGDEAGGGYGALNGDAGAADGYGGGGADDGQGGYGDFSKKLEERRKKRKSTSGRAQARATRHTRPQAHARASRGAGARMEDILGESSGYGDSAGVGGYGDAAGGAGAAQGGYGGGDGAQGGYGDMKEKLQQRQQRRKMTEPEETKNVNFGGGYVVELRASTFRLFSGSQHCRRVRW